MGEHHALIFGYFWGKTWKRSRFKYGQWLRGEDFVLNTCRDELVQLVPVPHGTTRYFITTPIHCHLPHPNSWIRSIWVEAGKSLTGLVGVQDQKLYTYDMQLCKQVTCSSHLVRAGNTSGSKKTKKAWTLVAVTKKEPHKAARS